MVAAEALLVVSTSPAPPELFSGALPEGTRVVRASYDELRELSSQAGIIIGDWSHVIHADRAVIERAGRCRLIQQPSAGYENIDATAGMKTGYPSPNPAPPTPSRSPRPPCWRFSRTSPTSE